MGKRRLLTSIISGAVIGGVISLFNSDTRRYAKVKLCSTRDAVSQIINNPTDSIKSVKQTIECINNRVSTESNNALNALDQIEDTLEKVTKRIE